MNQQLIALIGPFGTWEVVFLVGIALLIFGGKRLPEVGRSMGRGIVEFKKGIAGVEDDIGRSSQSNSKIGDRVKPTKMQ